MPTHHPYVFLNYTATPSDVLTLAHELGHAVHGYLARPQGIFHQSTPLTLAETASVFGETVTFERLLDQTDDPGERFALLAQQVEGNIATVFRQVAMNRFEDAVHTHRREVGELSIDDFADHWVAHPDRPLRRHGRGHRGLPHLVVLHPALHRHARATSTPTPTASCWRSRSTPSTRRRVPRSCPATSSCSRAGGSQWPEELASIVGCDLTDPAFWSAGLDIVDAQIARAEAAAEAAGRV